MASDSADTHRGAGPILNKHKLCISSAKDEDAPPPVTTKVHCVSSGKSIARTFGGLAMSGGIFHMLNML